MLTSEANAVPSISVATTPGLSEITTTPGFTSSARAALSASTANLVAQ